MAFGDIRNLTGAYGGQYASGATTFAAPTSDIHIIAIQALTDTGIGSTSAAGIGGITAFSSATIPAGQSVYGRFRQVVSTSGATIVYYGPGFS
jgi:hypothetical protein